MPGVRVNVRLFALCLIALALPATAYGRPGDLDETFSGDGLVSEGAPDAVIDLATGPGDSLIAAVNANSGASVHRYTAAGAPDPSFADRGVQAAPFSGGLTQAAVAAVDVRADGRILVGGTALPTYGQDFLVAELSPDGSQACSGAALCAPADFAGGRDVLKDVIAEPGGGTLAAGIVTDATGAHLGVARYLPSGALDTSFSGDGKLIFDSGGIATLAENAVVHPLPDGSVLLAGAGPGPDGSGRGDLLLAKLEPDGDLDPAFGGGDGWITVDVAGADDAESIAVGPDGAILVGIRACALGLHTDCDGAIARFSAAGTLDGSFGAAGVVPAAGGDVAVAGDGSIYATGQSNARPYFGADFSLERYLATGARDPGFSGDGIAGADFGLTHDAPVALDLTADGRPVVLGYVGGGSVGYTRLGLARFEVAAGPADADADGRLDEDDDCPERFGTNRFACPKIERKLELRASAGRLRAVLRSPVDLCVAGMRIQLLRVSRGSDETVARGPTSRSGKWTAPRNLPAGRYRVRVDAKLAKPIGRCAGARSKPRRNGA